MGRRALRNIDHGLELAGYYWEGAQLPARFDAQLLFRREAPLEVEVGSGKGLFLASASAARPDRNFLGIELARKYARFAAARLARSQAANAAILQLDAKWAFQVWLPDGCAAAVHIYFPDPWWKKRHHKRRIMTGAFLQHVQRVLQPGGQLHFWTDVEQYYRESLEVLRTATGLAGPFAEPEAPAQHDLDYRTHFERRTRLQAQQVFRSEFRQPQ